MNIFVPSSSFKPFSYPWAFNAWKQQQQMHWMYTAPSMQDDVSDWNTKLTAKEQQFLTHVFRFFTQGDIDIAAAYTQLYLPSLRNNEIQMMLLSFAAMETMHITAYSHLIETIGMPDTEYQMFNQYKAMKDKHAFMDIDRITNGEAYLINHTVSDFLKNIVIFSIFGEGLQLFSSFAMLLNFPRQGRMKGMGQIVTWSIRDETLHVESMTKVFNTIIDEFNLDRKDLKDDFHKICETMIELEDAFIDLAFQNEGVKGLSIDEIKSYIRYIADRRLAGIGYKPIYKVKKNPLPWLAEMVNAPEFANFFEQRPTEYGKASTTGQWSEVTW